MYRGFNGTSNSIKTWQSIMSAVKSWKDKKVCDLSCFHGYFLFKAIDAGVDPTSSGHDLSPIVLKTTKMINTVRKGKAKLKVWAAGSDIKLDETPDVIFALNCVHHWKNKKVEAYKKMIANDVIVFEVNKEDVALIKEMFNVTYSTISLSRPWKRVILFAKNK
jgi:ribosomal protein L30E